MREPQPTFETNRTPGRYTDGPMFRSLMGRFLHFHPKPYQAAVIDLALERIDGPGSPLAYDQVVWIVGRRCGKTVTALAAMLMRAMAGVIELPDGRTLPFYGAHTAQNLIAARKRFLKDLAYPFQSAMGIDNWRPAHDLQLNLASTTLTIDPHGFNYRDPDASQVQVYAPTAGATRGEGMAHLTLDEALTFRLEDGESILASSRPTMTTYKGHAQQWIMSNISARTDTTDWITSLRDDGRAAVRAGRNTGMAYVEWSMPADGDPSDESLWWKHMPGLSAGLVRIEELRRELEVLKPARFGAEYLGLWPDQAGIAHWAAISSVAWERAALDPATDALDPEAPYRLGVDLDPLGRAATIVAATDGPDGSCALEVMAHGQGTAWVLDLLKQRGPGAVAVAVDDYGPGRDLIGRLAREAPDVNVCALGTRDAAAACFAFDQALADGTARVWPNGDMTDAAAAAIRTTGKAWTFERRVEVPQTPLMGAVLALWAHRSGVAAQQVEAAIY